MNKRIDELPLQNPNLDKILFIQCFAALDEKERHGLENIYFIMTNFRLL